ncbi:LVIVD repeat-containing protein [Agromyces sp. NPDC058126]|uniref:LVIVD repeat-containing protein n=1 Tax=Agromyces sp. NPDC058126 TaxID=3346350 RepID=UPI0036DEDD6A
MTATAAVADDDPRVDLPAGLFDAGLATSGIDLLSSSPGTGPFASGSINSDLAFTGDHAIVGSYNGFQVYDVSEPAAPVLQKSFLCPGGQGDVSVYGDLLFMSVEQTLGRIDCGTQGAAGSVNPERFRGVRIFDISDIDNPVQLPGVQTCRGSHTHTVVADPDDAENVYIYNSGTSGVRSPLELPGCQNATLTADPVTTGDPTQWRIDVIKVPLDAPETAAVVSQPRIFTNPDTGAYNGLQNTLGGQMHPSGTVYSPTPNTNTCHDITAYPEIGLAAGACQGNGILLDISDPVNPVRIDAVADPNFSYWHSATFNNDGTKVIFTDEWGGGSGARCRATDQPEWGANALFDIVDGKLEFASYYKLPVPQTVQENCVAHNGSLIPVPGRDIMVQAWYQGGLSIIDFTDTANPTEIAYLDRGPINGSSLVLGGYWSTYWYNGNVLGSEIARGFDTMALTASDLMSENEIAAAGEVQLGEFNAQAQIAIVHEPSFAVARSYIDQAERDGSLSGNALAEVRKHVDKAEKLADGPAAGRAVVAQLDNAARKSGAPADSNVVQGLTALAATFG